MGGVRCKTTWKDDDMRTKTFMAVLSGILLLGVAGCGGGSSKTGTSHVPPFVTIAQPLASGAPMNVFATTTLEMPGLNILPLALSHNGANLNSFYPVLATHWALANHDRTLTLWLRSNAKWSNGRPVTAQDVATTMACSYAIGVMKADGLGSVKILGPDEIQLSLAPGLTSNTFLGDVLGTEIVPTSVFGPLLPKNIWSVINASQYTGSNATKVKASKAASKTLAALGARVTSFAPAQDVSAGPFVISSVNPGELIMRKNPDFYAQQNIRVNQVIVRNYQGSQQLWNYSISGQVDAMTGTTPPNVYAKAKRTRGNVFYQVPEYAAVSLIFNEHAYPYNLVAVRQALAYVINRQAAQHLAIRIGGTPVTWIDGMAGVGTEEWLTGSQRASLNTYPLNLAKAARLLMGAGFTKVGSQWMLPNGKPWTATITDVSQFSSWMILGQYIKASLTNFGIHTSLVGMTFPQMLAEQSAGRLPLSFQFGGLGPNPYLAYNLLYGPNDGYTRQGNRLVHNSPTNPTGGNFIDFPTVVNLPGYGNVNAGQLTAQLNSSISPSVVRHDTHVLALLTNQEVPEITLYNVLKTGWVNTQRFTDYPLKNATLMRSLELYWTPVGFWMLFNYIHPRA